MTTRRSRLHIRPNIGRGAKETGNDVPAKKMPVITGKCSPRKEAKENTNLSTRSEGNNVTEQVIKEIACDKTSIDHFGNSKELTETGSASQNDEDYPTLSDAHSCLSVSPNEMNVATDKNKVISENYSALLNTNRKCTVVLDRTIVPASKHIEKIERDSPSIRSENCSSIKNTVVKLSSEKEQKCGEKEQSEHIGQNACETGLKNIHSLNLLPSDTEKEKNVVQSKEKLSQQDGCTNSSGKSQLPVEDNVFVKPVTQNLSTCLSEKKSSNKTQNSQETKRRNRFSKKPPERGIMTMMDLIHYNPPNNPMSHEKKTDCNVTEADESILQIVEKEVENASNLKDGLSVEESSLETETEELPGPRVMIGPNGDITIDEDSLVIRRIDPEQNASKQVVHEVAECTYNSFRKPRPKHYWTIKETARFYKALSIVGTDFSLMLNLFPKRNRQELKNKFKREERLNRHLVDRAIKDPQQFDLSAFDDDEDNNDASEDETRNGFKRTKQCNNRKKNKRRKYVKGKGSLEDDVISDDDISIEETISKPNENAGIRKSTRKRKETSKEITTYSATQTMKRKPQKPRIPKYKRKAENLPVECEYESVEIQEVPNENLEVVSEDQSIIVCHSPLSSQVVHRSDLHINVRETAQDKRIPDNNSKVKQNEQQRVNIVKQPCVLPLQQTSIETPALTNNMLQAINSSQSNLTLGQLVLVPGKTNNSNEQVVHVYVVSQSPLAQRPILATEQNMQNVGGSIL